MDSVGTIYTASNAQIANESAGPIEVKGVDFIPVNGWSTVPSIDLRSFDTSSAKSMSGMFRKCSSITSLDLSNFKITETCGTENMFNSCKRLTTLNIGDFDAGRNRCSDGLFYGCNIEKLIVGSKDIQRHILEAIDASTTACIQTVCISPRFGEIHVEDNVEYRFGLAWNGIMWTTPPKHTSAWGIKMMPNVNPSEVLREIHDLPVVVA